MTARPSRPFPAPLLAAASAAALALACGSSDGGGNTQSTVPAGAGGGAASAGNNGGVTGGNGALGGNASTGGNAASSGLGGGDPGTGGASSTGGGGAPSGCQDGMPCFADEACGTAPDPSGCSVASTCDASLHYVCITGCSSSVGAGGGPIGPTGCKPGAACSGNDACGSAPDPSGCATTCTCSGKGTYECDWGCGAGCPPQAPLGYGCLGENAGVTCSYPPNTGCLCPMTSGVKPLWMCAL